MIEDFNLLLLSGGLYHCDASWSKPSSGLDQCYKFYFPVSGGAALDMDSGSFEIKPGRVFFISGFRLKGQKATPTMDVHWIHFVPESLYLRYLLDQLAPVCSWSVDRGGLPSGRPEHISHLFESPGSEQNRPRFDASPALACRIHGFLLDLISTLLEMLDQQSLRDIQPEYYRLKPSLDFMKGHYRDNPPLKQIAGATGLAPNYFHRRFSHLFGITPFNYMLAQRMNKARHLLSGTAMSIKEVASATGYDDALYFTRVFTRQMQISPSSYRASNQGLRWPARATTPN